MTGAVSNNLTNFVQTISRLGSPDNAGQLNRAAQQTGGTAGTGGSDLMRMRELSPQVRNALEVVRNAQATVAEGQAAGETLGRLGGQVDQLRRMAQQAADPNLDAGARADLAARFNALQKEINTTAQGTTFQGRTLAEGMTRTGGGAETPVAPRVQVSGRTFAGGGPVSEQGAAIGESRVARAAGLADVEVADANTNALFRMRDTGRSP